MGNYPVNNDVQLITDEQMKAHNGLELFDQKALESNSRKLKVEKTMTVRDLYRFVARNMVSLSQ